MFQFLVQITNFNQEVDDREVTSTNLQIMNFNQADDREVQNSM